MLSCIYNIYATFKQLETFVLVKKKESNKNKVVSLTLISTSIGITQVDFIYFTRVQPRILFLVLKLNIKTFKAPDKAYSRQPYFTTE